MTTYITKSEAQKLIAEAKESLNARITELSKRCNLIEAEAKGDAAAIATVEREISEIQAEIAKLESEPTPEPPAPEPTPIAEPDVFYGTKLSDYDHQGGPVEEVTAPDGSGETVFAFVCSDISGTEGAEKVTDNPRCQLDVPASLPIEFWLSGAVWLPTSFPATIPGWWNLLEGPYGPPFDGSPPIEWDLRSGGIGWATNSYFPGGEKTIWRKPLVRGKKLTLLQHVIQSKSASTGLVEMWLNGEPVCSQKMATLDGSNSEGPQGIYLQSYRMKGMVKSTVTIYHWPLKIGTTRASVGG